jgi:hypothetical protein
MAKPIDVVTFPQQMEYYLAGGKDSVKVADPEEAQRNYYQELVKHLEQKLREVEAANTKLQHLDHMKDDFIKRTAHELRTPLTIIYGYGRLLQASGQMQDMVVYYPELKAYLDGLVESIERLHDVIDEIFTIYRLSAGEIVLKVGPANLLDIIQQALDGFTQATLQRNVHLEFQRDEWPVRTYVDADLLRLAFANLIGNAIKYTPDGGKVSVAVAQSGDKAKITIRDTGIGIPLEEQHRIFDRFYALQNTDLHSTSKTAFRGGGLGLGLSVCKSVIAAHGGAISVESAGQDEEQLPGSAFYIELPLRDKPLSKVPALGEP